MDPPIAPRRILLREPKDRLTRLGERGRPATPMRIRPMFRDEASMPTQDRLRSDQEQRPAVTPQRTSQRREQRSVEWFEPRPCDVTFQDLELFA